MPESFDDIRPWRDDEVAAVLKRVAAQKKLLRYLGEYKFPVLTRCFPLVSRLIFHYGIIYKAWGINSIEAFQQRIIAPIVISMLKKTVDSFVVKGAENINDKPFLLLSNHRDIVLDPALLDYALHLNSRQTMRLGVGDNLLQVPFAEDLMRLNKSFIVKRSGVTKREKYDQLTVLSNFVSSSLHDEGESVWLANREGRAKDSIDKSDIAIFKMLSLVNRKEPLAQIIDKLNLHVATICYELDPCDELKARELYAREQNKTYVKADDEDMRNILTGIKGNKGKIHITFSKQLKCTENVTFAQLQNQVDRVVMENYVFTPSNLTALQYLAGQDESYVPAYKAMQKKYPAAMFQSEQISTRINAVDEYLRPYMAKIYANPCFFQHSLTTSTAKIN